MNRYLMHYDHDEERVKSSLDDNGAWVHVNSVGSIALAERDARIAELEQVIVVRDRAIALGAEQIALRDQWLASWNRVFPSSDPVIARRMVEDRAKAEAAMREGRGDE